MTDTPAANQKGKRLATWKILSLAILLLGLLLFAFLPAFGRATPEGRFKCAKWEAQFLWDEVQ